jgi:hypothetical protein
MAMSPSVRADPATVSGADCPPETEAFQRAVEDIQAVFAAAPAPPPRTGFVTRSEIERRGVFAQESFTCGPTAIATLLRHRGLTDVDPKNASLAARLQYSLYDSAYNTAAVLASRGAQKLSPEETLGVHPEGMLVILRSRGLEAEWHDADFDPRGIRANAEAVPGGADYIARRTKELQGVSPASRQAELRGLRDKTDAALASGKSVLVRFAWGNDPEAYHWNVVHGIDASSPGNYIISDPHEGKILRIAKEQLRSDCGATEDAGERCLKGILVVDAPAR